MEKPKSQHVTEHLANERTILAWIRTSIAVMTLGVAINRFSLFLMEFHRVSPAERTANHHAESVGVALVVFGMMMMCGAAWHYLHVAKTIDLDVYRPQRSIVIVTSLAVIGIGGTALIWLFSA